MQLIQELNDTECGLLIKELSKIDANVERKVKVIKSMSDVRTQDALEYVVNESIPLWAKIFLNWEGRDYQLPILEETKKSRRVVLRLGRRLGKTECQCISILWHAFRQPNAIKNDANFTYVILVLAPYEKQIDLIFKRLNELIDNSTMYSSLLKKRKQHHIELNNGCTILGLTLGASSGEGSSTRGQKASYIMIDEVDKKKITLVA